MNVLILNAFGGNKKGSKLFEEFEKEIRKVGESKKRFSMY